jgi:methylglutaconyl-CoA hydratase
VYAYEEAIGHCVDPAAVRDKDGISAAVLACDLVVAGEDLKLGFPEVHRGLVAALVTTLLRRQVNDRAARELVLLGQTLDAQTAHAMGLANRVAPVQKLLDESLTMARQVCIGAPNAVVRSKRLLDELSWRPIRDDLRRALRYHLQQRNSAEAQEGMAAFNEKRFPKWAPRDPSA